ncbi:retrovirus-related pol polyprotein from transposon TNT 1-94 [Tanacetum coccineum]
MDLETAQTTTTAKLPILKQGEYDMWRLRIEQYFQVQDYALWDVIENGNSFKPVPQTTTNADGSSTSLIPGPVTTKEKVQKKNDVKARSMLLMALPNEHLMTFNQYKDAKTLRSQFEIFEKSTFGGIYHVVVWRNKPDLDTMSFDDLYNNFKIVEQEVKGTASSSSSSSSQNMAFVSSPSSTNEVNTAYGVSTANTQVSPASTQVSTASTQVSTANLSDDTVYAFLASQPNGSQLVYEDLEQIHEDDIEEMDLKWQLALLSIRTRRGPRNQDSRNMNQDSSRRTVNVEETSSKAMVAIDGAGFDWSYMADDEVPTNMALMAFSDSECRVTFSEHDSEITKDGKVIGRGIRKKDLYVMKLGNKPKDQICLATIDENCTLWHRRLGYVNMRLIQSLASKELVRNLHKLKFDQQLCDAYKIGKPAYASHKTKNIVSTTRYLELLHMDLFGPSAVRSYRGNRYTLVIVDDYSRYTWTRFLKDKTEAFDQFEIFSKKIQNQLGCTIVSIRTDHGREFDNEVQFGEFCNANGITHNFSAPRTPQSNGVVERKNSTLREMSRTMLNEQSLPQKFWCNAIDTSTYILNRILIRAILGKTPYELLRCRKPTLDYFRVFGSKCFILNTYLTKFDPKSYEGVFLGYSENSKAYIILNKHTRKVEESLNVTFDETPPPSKTSPLVDDDLDEEEAIKDRLVAQGYNQQEDIDYDETYAPVARLESIRILLAYNCALDFKIFKMDVKSAFLNGFINEEKLTALAISTTEAEYVSARRACQQSLWMKQAFIDYDIRLDDVSIMFDNKGAIDLSKNPVQHSRTKHIEIRHHFLRDNVQKGHISIEKVPPVDNIADILTKPLKRESFNYLRLGLEMMEHIP